MRAWRAYRSHRGSYHCSQQLLRHAPCRCIATTNFHIIHWTLLPRSSAGPTLNLCRAFNSCRILTDETKFPLLSPPNLESDDPSVWLQLVEPFLPERLREPSPSSNSSSIVENNTSPAHPSLHTIALALTKIISRARRRLKVDLLAHLAVEQGRWEAVLWISRLLVDYSKTQHPTPRSPHGLSTINWQSALSLEQISFRPFLFDNESTRHFSPKFSLQKISSPISRRERQESLDENRQCLGQLWQSLASLTLEAANRNHGESRAIMIKVVHILAYLRQRHLIPETILNLHPAADYDVLKRSDFFGNWATRMYDSLWTIGKSGIENLQHVAHNPLTISTKTSESYTDIDLRPHLWLEFILWSCIQGQYVMEASTIISEIAHTKKTWSLFSWRGINQPSVNPETNVASPLLSKQVGKNFQTVKVPNLVLQRLFSVEVVFAAIDGLVAIMAQGIEHNAKVILDRINELKGFLDHNRATFSNSTWDVLISRITSSPTVVTVERSPNLTESALMIAEDQSKKSQSRNRKLDLAPFAFGSIPSFVFDGSAAIIGLYFRTLTSYIDWHDKTGALRLLRGFFSWRNATDRQWSSRDPSSRPGVNPLNPSDEYGTSSFHSEISSSFLVPRFSAEVLAKLLDFTIDLQSTDLGKQMIYNHGDHEALIPTTLYSNTIIYSSLIRFAQETNDDQLLSQLSRAKDGTVAVEALIALCDHHLRQANFKSAMEILVLINRTLKRNLNVESVATLIKALLPHFYGQQVCEGKQESQPSRNISKHSSDEPAEFLQVLLGGDFVMADDSSRAQLWTVVQILTSLDPYLGELCSQFQPHEVESTEALPTSSFDCMIEAAVLIWGSAKGKEVYNHWCRKRKCQMRRKDISVAEQFSMPVANPLLQYPAKSNQARSKDIVVPELSTIRIIIQAAQNEVRAQASGKRKDLPKAGGARPQVVLAWASYILKHEFSLSRADTDYELGGTAMNRLPRQSKKPLYKYRTLRAWLALRGKRQVWTIVAENQLRSFAASISHRVLVMDQLGPTERFFVQCLCADHGLRSATLSDESKPNSQNLKDLKVWKTASSDDKPRIPRQTIDEYMERLYEAQDLDWEPEEDSPIIDMEPQRVGASQG